MSTPPSPFGIGWMDLTVPNAGAVRDFYTAVTGLSHSAVDMGGYDDYCLVRADGTPVAGVCHERGPNTGLPAQWIIYFTVDDLDARLALVGDAGGEILAPPKKVGEQGRYAVVRDPSGAVAALYQSTT